MGWLETFTAPEAELSLGLFRLFLAIVVAYDHWRLHVLVPLGENSTLPLFGFNAGHAVLFFYVISGFLITYTLTNNYSSDADGARRFYANRFIRIFSVYWPAAALSIAIFGFPAPSPVVPSQLLLFGQDWLGAFGYSGILTGLEQSWTLGAELTFYLIAPFLMRSWKLGAAICCVSIAARISFIAVLGDANSFPHWTYLFAPTTICFFLFGHLTCLVSQRWPELKRYAFALLAPATLLILPAILLFQYRVLKVQIAHFDNIALWIPISLFVLSMPALFEATKNNRYMNYVGNLSYPLYLTHIFVVLFAGQTIIDSLLPFGGAITAAAFIILCLAASVAVHELVEKPASSLMRHLLPRSEHRPKPRRPAQRPA